MFLENKKILFDTYSIFHCISVYLCDLGENTVCVSLLFAIACKYYDFLIQVRCFCENLVNFFKAGTFHMSELSRAKMFDGGKPITRNFLMLTLLQYVLTSFLNSA